MFEQVEECRGAVFASAETNDVAVVIVKGVVHGIRVFVGCVSGHSIRRCGIPASETQGQPEQMEFFLSFFELLDV